MNSVFIIWRDTLRRVLGFYESKRGPLKTFLPRLFIFFVLVNIICYWWAVFTVYSGLIAENGIGHYLKVQFPVGILGALFDSLSFFVTIIIIRRALRTQNNLEYIAHLFLDLMIAILATFWVLFVFFFSGWLIHILESTPQTFVARQEVYEEMVKEAVANPVDNWRNIYFGIIMGISTMLPTSVHVFLFIRSGFRSVFRQR